jgi:hypothetical protein
MPNYFKIPTNHFGSEKIRPISNKVKYILELPF